MIFRLIVFSLISIFMAHAKDEVKEKVMKKVFVSKFVAAEIFDSLVYPAKVSPKVNADVLSQAQGPVSEIKVSLGQKVKKNQVLVKVVHSDPVYRYRAQEVVSPVEGIVSKIFTNVGTVVSQGEKLLTVTDPRSYTISIEATPEDLSKMKSGMKGIFSIQGNSKKEIPVVIKGLSPIIDPVTGTGSVELSFSEHNNDVPFLMGELGRVSFKINHRQGIKINEDSLFYEGKQVFVKLVVEKKIKKVPVVLGQRRGGQVELLQGIKVGETFVERASGFLADGDEVEVVSEAP